MITIGLICSLQYGYKNEDDCLFQKWKTFLTWWTKQRSFVGSLLNLQDILTNITGIASASACVGGGNNIL